MLLSSKHIFMYLIKALIVASQSNAGEEYKLSNLYTPVSYQIDLSVTPEAFTETYNEFTGQAQINFIFTNFTDSIALHAQHDFITINKILLNNTELESGLYIVDNVTDILRINTTSEILIGEIYTLLINYSGVLSTSDMYGFYKSSYMDENGETKYLLTTMFAATYARRAFPCFDEPALKATFDLTFSFPLGLNVLFNTPQKSSSFSAVTGLQTVVFDTTPKMSTYLVAFIISEFTCTSGNSTGMTVYQVCSRNGSADIRELAVEYGPQLLDSLNNYTDYGYGTAMRKIDQVAIPDFAAGAMENWGLITYS